MKITREFCSGDCYIYDFGLCSYEKGWAQVDTAQDASYFGTWANPTRLMIFSYCEGDTTSEDAASPEEFATELREIDACNRGNGYDPASIDPGFDPAMKAAFEGLGWRTCCTDANLPDKQRLLKVAMFALNNGRASEAPF